VFIYNRGMSLTREAVQHIAELAQLQLTAAEEALYQDQLSEILDYIQKLNRLDTEAIPPTASVLPLRSVMRGDVSRPSMAVDEILANAPARSVDAFEVRVILED
jgi:aspartyl-tRNA(Asn)/glutamyl-tRNA(Gln) amidotransferase subunit C